MPVLRRFRVPVVLALALFAVVPPGAAVDLLTPEAEKPLELTDADQAWIDAHPVVRVGNDPRWEPIDFDDADGRAAGIAPDVLKLVEERLGITFEYVHNLTWAQAFEGLRRGEVDLLTAVEGGPDAEGRYALTKPYMAVQPVVAVHEDLPFLPDATATAGLIYALAPDGRDSGWLRRRYPNLAIHAVADADAALRAVSEGRADATVGHNAALHYRMQRLGIDNLKVAAPAGASQLMHMAVRPDWRPLARILDKALDSITPQERDRILVRWLAADTGRTLSADRERRRNLQIGAALVLAIVVVLYARRLRREIAERRRARQRADAAQRQLEEITNRIPGVVYRFRYTADGGFELLYASGGATQLLGRPAPSNILDAVAPEDRARLEQSLSRSARRLEPLSLDVRVRHSSGETRWVRASLVPHQDGDEIVWDGYADDITERKRLEDDLAAARARADSAERVKREFTANVSHEIRTPMNAIIGLTHLVMQTALDPRQRDYLGKIASASKALLRMINDMLDVARMESGDLALEPAPFSLRALLADLSALIERNVHEKGLTLRTHVDEAVPDEAIGDALRITQVLLNLANNAVKFTQQGEIVIRVEPIQPEGGDPDALWLRFEVGDTGIGIPRERADRLFQAFSQADASTTRAHGGAGLGLSICRRLVHLMSGEIDVDSEPGRGSRFWFTAKLARAPAAPAPAAAPWQPRRRELRGARILLADDNSVNLQVAREYLEAAGLVVDCVANGEQAVNAARAGDYDAILMDVHMPVMDGLQATREIRSVERLASLPIIALTSSVLEGDHRRVKGAGMNDHVSKPVNVDQLLSTLSRWITGRPLEARAPAANDGFPVVEGFDTAAGLGRCGGDRALYARLLAQFQDVLAQALGDIRATLGAGDRAGAQSHVHALKGVAGNLAATGVLEAARRLEERVRAGEAADAALEGLETAARLVLNALSRLPPTAATAAAGRPPDLATLARHVRDLDQRLSDSDVSAVKVLEELRRAMGGAHATAMDELGRLIGTYDFDGARRRLARLASMAGIRLAP